MLMNKRRLLSNLQRDTMSWVLIVSLLVAVGVAAFYLVSPQLRPQTTIHIGDGVFSTDIIARGSLSDERQLAANQAVMVVYGHDDKWPVVVKGRQAPLDIVWLSSEKKVVHIVKNIQADQSTVSYEPSDVARYVVELPAGAVDSRTIGLKSVAVFDERELTAAVR